MHGKDAMIWVASLFASLPPDIKDMVLSYVPDYEVLHVDGTISVHYDSIAPKKYHDAVSITVHTQFTISDGSNFGRHIKNISGPGQVILIGNMYAMFRNAELFDCDVSNWDVSRVTDMSCMFHGAKSFRGAGLENWDVSRVTDMRYMFSCTAVFDANLSSWNVSRVTNMTYMFHGARSFNGDVSNWNVSCVTNMSCMFSCAISFTGVGLENWNVSCVTNMSCMFSGAISFTGAGLENWNVLRVMDMTGMFIKATSLETFPSWYIDRRMC